MKILFVTRRFPPSVGGKQQFSYDLYTALAQKTDVVLVKWGWHGKWQSVILAMPYLFLKSFWTLLLKNVDVIYMPDPLLAPMGKILGWMFHKPLAITVHGLDITYTNWLFQAIIPRAVRGADAVVCISQASTEAVKAIGINESKILIITPAVYDDLFGKADREYLLKNLNLQPQSQILLTVGRLVARKGVYWFINNVMPELVRRYPNLVYLVVGEGEERTKIESAINKQRLAKRVLMLGQATGDLFAAAYNGADVFVMPNLRVPGDMEGFGLVLLEASLCARPIVASDLEGIQDAITDGRNGVLVRPGDVNEFVGQIAGFLDNSKQSKQFGQQSRRYTLQHYQWSKIADRYIEVFEQIG